MIYQENLKKLIDAGVENSSGDLTSLISFVAGISYEKTLQLRLISNINNDYIAELLSADQIRQLQNLVYRRSLGEPLQYIIGTCDFYGHIFYTEKHVLIPRCDTECIVEYVSDKIAGGESILDLCCGSGCIGISLALEKNINLTLADISDYALELSKKNSNNLGLKNVKFLKHDLFSQALTEKYDFIVSNPPYIASGDIPLLSVEVKKEPILALDGGVDGLDFYKVISEKYKEYLNKNGTIVFECGVNQAYLITEIMKKNGFKDIEIKKDLNNIDRIVCGHI